MQKQNPQKESICLLCRWIIYSVRS